jgi:hypothetical protein
VLANACYDPTVKRLFLYTYKTPENYQISVNLDLFGAPDAKPLSSKIEKITSGDLIVIRDSRASHDVTLFGCGLVTGELFHQFGTTPYRPEIWPDEQREWGTLYPLRIAVDFKTAPQPKRRSVPWSELDLLGIAGTNHPTIRGPQAWTKFFSGNLVTSEKEVRAICCCFGISG